MWQYLVVFVRLQQGVFYWEMDLGKTPPGIDRHASLNEGCAAFGRAGWELVAVTEANDLYRTQTLFFKKPAVA